MSDLPTEARMPRQRKIVPVRIAAPTLVLLLAALASGAFAQQPKPSSATVPAITPNLVLLQNAPYAADAGYIRFGAPISYSARMLPADATGTFTFSVDQVPVATVPVSTQSPADYVAVGASVTYAGYIADPAQRYQFVVGQALSRNVSSYGSPGYTTCDAMQYNVLPNSVGLTTVSNPLYSLSEMGGNEVLYYGVGANEALFNLCHQAALTWLGVSRQNKVLAGDAGISIGSPNWTSVIPSNLCCLNQLVNTAGSGTVRFTLTTSGGAAYLWYVIQLGVPGTFAVSVDGGAYGTPVSSLMPSTEDPVAGSYALLRLPVAAGIHTFDITAQSGNVGVLGMGTRPPASSSSIVPTLLVTDVPVRTDPTLAAIAVYYSADILNNIALLSADGLDLRLVPTDQYWMATPATTGPAGHPNAVGLADFAQAFESVVTPASAPVQAAMAVATGGFVTSTLPIGGHEISVQYSGDGKYGAASGAAFAVIYDATSSTTLVSSGSVLPTQTPVTLTASVPQSNATGLVAFIDQTSSGSVTLGTAWMNIIAAGSAQVTVAALAPGQHTIVAQYAGDAQYNASSSQPVSVTISAALATVSLSAPATRYYGGAPVPLTATVSPSSATGTVTFYDGATVLAKIPVVSGVASFTPGSLATGIHSLAANYSGDSTQNPAQSPALSIEIDYNSTTVALAAGAAAVPWGTAVALQASISPTATTGLVGFGDSFTPLGQTNAQAQTTLGQSTIVNGTATFNATALAPGTHALNAVYAGDSFDLPSASSAAVVQVGLASSTTTLASIPASVTYASPVVLTATVSPAASSGTVTFSDSGSGKLAEVGVVNGAASFSLAALATGSHLLSAAYSGDNFRAGSTSAAVSTTVNPVGSSIALAALPGTIYAGSPLALSATVVPAAATGSVIFRDQTLGVLGQAAVVQGAAALTVAGPSVGGYSITAVYSGDANDAGSSSAAVATRVALDPTSTSVASSAATAPVGSSVNLTATLSPGSATGTVTFFNGSAMLGTAVVSNGRATLAASALPIGADSLHAVYSGDNVNAASTSASMSVTITANVTSTTLTLAQNSVVAGAAIAVNVRVAAASSTPTGSVTIRSGGSVVASATLTNAAAGAAYATLSIDSTTLGLGTFPLAAFYSGDAEDAVSDSSGAPVAVSVAGIPTAAALTLSATQIPVGGVVTLGASVSASGVAPPTGSVSFLSNGVSIGTAALTGSGSASFSFTPATATHYALAAVFVPSGLFAAASTAPQNVTVTAPLSAALTPSSVNVTAGSTASANLVITPLSGFTGAMKSTCQTSASFLTCTVTAPSAMVSGPMTVPVQITVAQNSASLARTASGTALLALMLPLLALGRSRRVARLLSLLVVCVFSSLYLTGCTLGGDFGDVPAGAQSAAITITAAGTSFVSTITINVTQ